MQNKSFKLLEQVQEIIKSYNFALTLRQIYYQLVAKQIIENKHKNYMRLSRLCVLGRDEGLLDEDAFADRLRQPDKLSSWSNLADFLEDVKYSYIKNKWRGQDDYVEIWSEKDALRGVLTEITHPYDVALLVVRGQVSRTAIYEASCRYERQIEAGKNCHLFYAGDFDPSGLSIYNSLVERLRSRVGEYINFERIALSPEQIKQYALPSDPAKQSDPNYKKFVSEYGDTAVELDSLPPDVLRNIVKNRIEKCINLQVLEQVQKTEANEQVELQRFISLA